MMSKVTIQLGERCEGAPLLQDRAAATEMAGCGSPLLRGRAAPRRRCYGAAAGAREGEGAVACKPKNLRRSFMIS